MAIEFKDSKVLIYINTHFDFNLFVSLSFFVYSSFNSGWNLFMNSVRIQFLIMCVIIQISY